MGAMENALPGQLAQTIERVKGVGDAGYFEGDFRAPADDEVGGDAVSLNEERELAFEVRGRLEERANRLSEALVRVRSGDYGDLRALWRGDLGGPAARHPGGHDLRDLPGYCGAGAAASLPGL